MTIDAIDVGVTDIELSKSQPVTGDGEAMSNMAMA